MTATELLIELKLGKQGPLTVFVQRERAAGATWTEIAETLTNITGIDVSREFVRRRYNIGETE